MRLLRFYESKPQGLLRKQQIVISEHGGWLLMEAERTEKEEIRGHWWVVSDGQLARGSSYDRGNATPIIATRYEPTQHEALALCGAVRALAEKYDIDVR